MPGGSVDPNGYSPCLFWQQSPVVESDGDLVTGLFARCGVAREHKEKRRLRNVHDEDGDVKDPTFGAGVGLPFDKYQARFDYARIPGSYREDHENRFGMSFGVFF